MPGARTLQSSGKEHSWADIVHLPGLASPVRQGQSRGAWEKIVFEPILLVCALFPIVGIVWVQGRVNGITVGDTSYAVACHLWGAESHKLVDEEEDLIKSSHRRRKANVVTHATIYGHNFRHNFYKMSSTKRRRNLTASSRVLREQGRRRS